MIYTNKNMSLEYLIFNVIRYIKLVRVTQLNRNSYKKVMLIFILIDFSIELYIGFFMYV